MTKVYCCYGMYCDVGHSDDCKGAVPTTTAIGSGPCNLSAEGLSELCAISGKQGKPDSIDGLMRAAIAWAKAYAAWERDGQYTAKSQAAGEKLAAAVRKARADLEAEVAILAQEGMRRCPGRIRTTAQWGK